MHHPPTLLGCKMMDTKYPLKNIIQTQEIFTGIERNLTIFCGHYHDDLVFKYKNQEIFVSPSNVFQIDEGSVDFRIKTYNPGWRFVELGRDKIITEVNYINIARER
jgi:Icc protein